MATNFDTDSPLFSSTPIPTRHTVKPRADFYSIFSEEEVVEIIHALEVKREIPLKYSYKDKGAKIWNNFYLKYLSPRWYRTSNVEIDLLRENFRYINYKTQTFEKINIVDVGAGNSYPVKEFISKLSALGRINKYIALDISEELLKISSENFNYWFPKIEFCSYIVDVETNNLRKILFDNKANIETGDIVNVFLHLGVTMGNHKDRCRVLKNFRDSMGKNDLLVFTNETGSSSKWDGTVRGGFKYHADQVYAWIKDKMGIRAEDCELVKKYDVETDSIVANIKLKQNYIIEFRVRGIDKKVEIYEGEEITIWRHHKYEIPELRQEIEQSGLQLVHFSTDKYLSHVMVICEAASN